MSIPSGVFGRGKKIFGIASKVAMKEISSRLSTWESEKDKLLSKVQLAQDVVDTLSQLKGASMKVGQLLSLDLGDYLPPEVVKVLTQLQQSATFMGFDEVQSILQKELGEKFSDLTEISKTPIAAASIGQVHRAKLQGKDVVVKVQYPGVAKSIPSDMKLLEFLLKKGSLVFDKSKTDITPFLDEVREMLLREADYTHEIKMHELYRQRFAESNYHVPLAYPDYSTGVVLVQDFVEGKSFTNWLETSPDLKTKEELADLFMRLYLEEVFKKNIVQTDPNPGNFLITPDNNLALIDFGAVKDLPHEFVEGYRRILIHSRNGDVEGIIQESIALGFLDSRESRHVFEFYAEMMMFLAAPFKESALFDFNDKTYVENANKYTWELTRKCKYSPPPKDLLFLHRKLAGIFTFIKRLGVPLDLSMYWEYVEKK